MLAFTFFFISEEIGCQERCGLLHCSPQIITNRNLLVLQKMAKNLFSQFGLFLIAISLY
ncbi:hypothetical protein T4B_10975 [Trichinella pseudospiralis]|uniref:Uncharacterized protein n=1 Tax=Trichinella pseudospiralis TaxID=6337 RepID=A0A0V1JKG0_TRIPS|nr:hypothetical protein T4B_2395 [Trichinella pseudospiralis]KRY97711.1 hypothetical protein T4B_10975 [Trichinella pseudospiralis]KRZ35418.1 hypothetical protein T4C_13618 [Trichinella pseudospiralis]